ncbi:MAG: hypothetical protein M3460_09220 [Actinomycetota bacterium]|nr:hypothetical protein [Actinomycetota bacterium]
MQLTVMLLLAAVGLLVAALGTGHISLAWGSVAVSAVVAAMILVRWRRSWRQIRDAPEAEPVLLPEDKPVKADHGDELVDSGQGMAPIGDDQLVDPAQADPVARVSAGADGDAELADAEAAEPGEEETDAADLLVVYELTDEVLVVDEHPRYHLPRCPWPDRARTERLPVREARELGFTPCGRCRPDFVLARKHRAAAAG